MGRLVRADNTISMDSPHTLKCPNCGTVVELPAYCRAVDSGAPAGRLDQLARAVCGCWMSDLPEEATIRLVKTLAKGTD